MCAPQSAESVPLQCAPESALQEPRSCSGAAFAAALSPTMLAPLSVLPPLNCFNLPLQLHCSVLPPPQLPLQLHCLNSLSVLAIQSLYCKFDLSNKLHFYSVLCEGGANLGNA